MTHFFYSFITLIIALFFFILGFIAMLIPWSSGISNMIVSFIVNQSLILFLFGLGFAVIGAALALHIILSSRRRYVTLHLGKLTFSISEKLIGDYLSAYWKELFPHKEIPYRVVLKKHSVEITADLPFAPLEVQKDLLEKIEKDLGDLFRDVLGYREDLNLEISFQPKP